MMPNFTVMGHHGSALILILVEYMEWCHVGIGRAESRSINIIGIFFIVRCYYCLVFEMSHAFSNPNTMAMTHGSGLILILLEHMQRRGAMMALDEQKVR